MPADSRAGMNVLIEARALFPRASPLVAASRAEPVRGATQV